MFSLFNRRRRSATRQLAFEQIEQRALLSADGFGAGCVPAAGEPGDVITSRLEATDSAGIPIETLQVGEEFMLRVYAQDTRDVAEERGVFAFYLDIRFDPSSAEVSGPLQFSADYPNGHLGNTSTRGIIDDAGAFTNKFSGHVGESLIFSVPMMATEAGSLHFTTDPADNLPRTEMLVLDTLDAVQPEDILFGTTSLAVTWQGDVDLDLDVDFADFLAFSAQFGNSGPDVGRADIDGDGQVAFGDFLLLSQNFGNRWL